VSHGSAEILEERFGTPRRDHFYFVHDRNQFFVEARVLFGLERRHHAVDHSDSHTIRQRMIGGFLGSADTCADRPECPPRANYLDFDFLNVVGLDLCSFTVFIIAVSGA